MASADPMQKLMGEFERDYALGMSNIIAALNGLADAWFARSGDRMDIGDMAEWLQRIANHERADA